MMGIKEGQPYIDIRINNGNSIVLLNAIYEEYDNDYEITENPAEVNQATYSIDRKQVAMISSGKFVNDDELMRVVRISGVLFDEKKNPYEDMKEILVKTVSELEKIDINNITSELMELKQKIKIKLMMMFPDYNAFCINQVNEAVLQNQQLATRILVDTNNEQKTEGEKDE